MISGDGRYVAFGSAATNLVAGGTTAGVTNVYRHDRVAGTTALASVPTSGSVTYSVSFPAISADGRYVSFSSSAPNLVAGDTNGVSDIFLRDIRLCPVGGARCWSGSTHPRRPEGTLTACGDSPRNPCVGARRMMKWCCGTDSDTSPSSSRR